MGGASWWKGLLGGRGYWVGGVSMWEELGGGRGW